MSMRASFFDIEKDSMIMFDGLPKIAKESIFTGTNNFVSDTIAATCLDEYEEVICYGVAFYKKRCAVKREKRMEM